MKNITFKRLLNLFAKLPAGIPAGGRDNADNAWYYNLVDSLNDVAVITESLQDLDADEFEHYSQPCQEAFNKLSDAIIAMQNMGREAMPPELKDIFNAVSVAGKPVSFYAKSLAEGKSLKTCFSDPSWITGMFNKEPANPEPADDIIADDNAGKMSFQENLEQYREDAEKIRERIDGHLAFVSGDETDPLGILEAKLRIIQDYIDSCETKEPFNVAARFTDGLHELQNYLATTSREDLKNAINKNLFSDSLPRMFDLFLLSSEIEGMQDVSDDAKGIIKKEFKKLSLKQKDFGFPEGLPERLEKNIKGIQSLSVQFDSMNGKLLFEYDVERTELVDSFLVQIKSTLDRTKAYLNNREGAVLPSEKDFEEIAEKIKLITLRMPMFLSDGGVSTFYEDCCSLFKEIKDLTPDLTEKLTPEYDRLIEEVKFKNIKNYFEKSHQPGFYDESEEAQKLRRYTHSSTSSLLKGGLIDRKDFNELTCIKMAIDPEFNEFMIKEAEKIIGDLSKHILDGNKDKEGKSSSSVFLPVSKTGDFSQLNDDPREQYEYAYNLYFMGKKIQLEHKKAAEAKKGGADAVKNSADPLLKGLMTADNITPDLMKDMGKAIEALHDNEVFKIINQSGPVVLNEMLKSQTEADYLVEQMNKPVLDLSDKTLAALVQKSGNFYASNSDSYEKISNDIKSVFKKGLRGTGREDFIKLYNDCKDYCLSHRAVPKSSNGKLRVNSVKEVMNKLSVMLSVDHPELEGAFLQDKAVQMVRNKEDRTQTMQSSIDNIRKVLTVYNWESGTALDTLPDVARDEISKQLHVLCLAKGINEVMGQEPDNAFNEVPDEDDLERINNHIQNAKAYAEDLHTIVFNNPTIFTAYVGDIGSKDALVNTMDKQPVKKSEAEVALNNNIVAE